MKNTLLRPIPSLYLILLFFTITLYSYSSPPNKREFYEIKIYHLKTKVQEERVDRFLKSAFLPALHRAGIAKAGVFKPVEQDTADQKIYVLIPFKSLDEFAKLPRTLLADKAYSSEGKDYLDAPYDDAPYSRIESIILQAFTDMPAMKAPALNTPPSDRIYELRSYEGPTEKLYHNKVHMFNEGKEIAIFTKLGFNAVFYAEVLSGRRMPNLMYMTSFTNKASRDEHWKAFGSDPDWKKLSSMSEYQHNVSKSEIIFLHPTEYSEI